MPLDTIDQDVAGGAHPPTQNDHLGVEAMLSVDAGDGQVPAGVVPDVPGQPIAIPGGLDDVLAGDGLYLLRRTGQYAVNAGPQLLAHPPSHAVSRGVLFETTPLSARAGSPLGLHDPVAQFRGVLEVTVQRFAAQDHSGSYAGAQGQHDHVPHLAARANPELSIGGCIAVVVQHGGQVGASGQLVADGQVRERRQVGGFVDDAST